VDRGAPAVVRWADEADRAAFREVVRLTREAAYGALIGARELRAASDGSLPVRRSWHHGPVRPVGLLVGVADGRVVGGAELELLEDREGELATFYVLPAYQGRGIGGALWEASLTALRGCGAEGMQVWTMAAASWSRRFYEARGARVTGAGTVWIGDGALPHVGYRVAL
jgi:ribosomal protein S18 acetylase RimI-like enzyme